MDINILPKTAKEARKINSDIFFTNLPCKRGHLAVRLTSDYKCLLCKTENKVKSTKKYESKPENKEKKKLYRLTHKKESKKYREDNKEYLKNLKNNWIENNKEYSKEYAKNYRKEYYKNNKEKCDKAGKDWADKNRDKINKKHREYKKERSKDPIWKLNRDLSCSINKSLKGNKGGRKWKTLVNFSLLELKLHLENQFEDWMSWANRGAWDKNKKTWHIDHIKPISLCSSFDEAWQLSNLRPLEASKNLSKGNRYIG